MTDWEERALAIASFRYRVIADAAEAQGGEVTLAIQVAAQRDYVDPEGAQVRFTERTLWRWLSAYRERGLLGLKPRWRKDRGSQRALSKNVLEKAARLRREKPTRATKSVIDILERTHTAGKGEVKRATLDRYLLKLGLSRRRLRSLGKKTYRQIRTEAPLELVIADFHHGPYVRVGDDDRARRALLLAFIDHFSRYILEGRYYLSEDFAALRFGFRRLLLVWGLIVRLYVDNGPSFQSGRFHAACKNEALDIQLVHSKPYVSEGRGVCERFNRTDKEQFESEVRGREELLTLDELNAYFEAWLAERYHTDVHSETGQAPFQRFHDHAVLRPAPDLARLDELLRLRRKATVHKKWSTVQVAGLRYVVSPPLRGRRVHVLYDPLDPEYVLVEFDGRVIERAYRQKPGVPPPEPDDPEPPPGKTTDYLALLRADYEKRTRAELGALRMRSAEPAPELQAAALEDALADLRGAPLTDGERSDVAAFRRKWRPIAPDVATTALAGAKRRLGTGLHLRVYLDALQSALLRTRTQGDKKP